MKSFIIFCLTIFFIYNHSWSAIDTVGRYDIYEIRIPHSQSGYQNVWENVHISALFTSPQNRAVRVNGFYHSQDLWMVRFVPDETGEWKYEVQQTDGKDTTGFSGVFTCIQSVNKGFIRQHPNNPMRWIYSSDGTLYPGVGFGDCKGVTTGSILGTAGMDGGFRPPGYHEGIGWSVPYDQYLIAYGDVAGFNLYRYSDGNCAYSIVNTISSAGNSYDVLHSLWTDSLFTALRQHGFRIYMTIMGGPRGSSSDTASMSATNRYAQYCIDRYSSFVDFWELTNESNPDDQWISIVANYIRAHDPYHHFISMSNEKPAHPAIDIISPHWYGKEADASSDIAVANNLNQFRQFKKPVIWGEQGDGGAWDSTSALRMRGRLWSAFFNEGIIIFWNTSFAKDCCNEFLGWENRRYVRALQAFASNMDSGVVRYSPSIVPANNFRAWGLHSSKVAAVYIRNSQNVKSTNSNVQITVDVPVNGNAIWFDVQSGEVISSQPVSSGSHIFTAPSFISDIAFFAGEFFIPAQNLFGLDITPRTYEWINIPAGRKVQMTAKISNIGSNSLTINQILIYGNGSQYYSVDLSSSLPFQLAAGTSVNAVVTYAPTDTVPSSPMISFVHTGSLAWDNLAVAGVSKGFATNVEEAKLSAIDSHLYPNPVMTTQQLIIEASHLSESATVMMYDMLGRSIMSIGESLRNEGKVILNTKIFSPGMYYFLVRDNDNIKYEKVVILR